MTVRVMAQPVKINGHDILKLELSLPMFGFPLQLRPCDFDLRNIYIYIYIEKIDLRN